MSASSHRSSTRPRTIGQETTDTRPHSRARTRTGSPRDLAGLEAINAKVIDIQAQSLDDSTTCTPGVVTSCWANFVSATIAQALADGDGDDASGAWVNENPNQSTTLMEQVIQHFIGPQGIRPEGL